MVRETWGRGLNSRLGLRPASRSVRPAYIIAAFGRLLRIQHSYTKIIPLVKEGLLICTAT